jgi:hypothetical protein
VNAKRILILLALAFVAYYVLRSPQSAATALRASGHFTLQGMKYVAEALAKFIDTLFA